MVFELIKTSNDRLLSLIIFYVAYLFVGAMIFKHLEAPYEAKVVKELNEYVEEFRKRHSQCLDLNELNSFIKLVSQANDRGVPAVNHVSKEPNWSFGQAVFFAGTVLTTIGYGDVTVQTRFGKVFCMLFASIGIPTTLLLLYAVIERLMKLTNFLFDWFCATFQPILNRTSCLYEKVSKSHMHSLFTLGCALLVLIFLFIVPAWIYSRIEEWSFLNSFYYCFISLTTVGLGDYVPGDAVEQKHRHFYKIISTLYLIVGVTIMVWLLEIFSESEEFNLYKYFTLTKNGILTSHKDQVHTICSTLSEQNDVSGQMYYKQVEDDWHNVQHEEARQSQTGQVVNISKGSAHIYNALE